MKFSFKVSQQFSDFDILLLCFYFDVVFILTPVYFGEYFAFSQKNNQLLRLGDIMLSDTHRIVPELPNDWNADCPWYLNAECYQIKLNLLTDLILIFSLIIYNFILVNVLIYLYRSVPW